MSICLGKEDKRKTNADENVTDATTPLQMNCKLVTLLRQQLFHIQQRRILKFWILTKTIRLKLLNYLTAAVIVKRKLNLKKKVRTEVTLFFVRRRSFERTWIRANLCKRKIKDEKHLYWILCIPFTCWPIPNQNIDFSENSTKHLLRLQLVDTYSKN